MVFFNGSQSSDGAARAEDTSVYQSGKEIDEFATRDFTLLALSATAPLQVEFGDVLGQNCEGGIPMKAGIITVKVADSDEKRFSHFFRVLCGSSVMMQLSLLLAVLLLTSSTVACSHTITVNWSKTRQTIDGFGASGAGMGPNANSRANEFFPHFFGDWPSMVQDADISRTDGLSEGSRASSKRLRRGVFWADSCHFRPFNGSSRSGKGSEGFRK